MHRPLSALLIIAAFLLTGCFNGPAATTTVQAGQLTGNGVQGRVGNMLVENAVLVTNDANTSLVVRVYNTGTSDDTLVQVTINGERARLNPDPVTIPAGGSISFGFPDPGESAIQTGGLTLSQFVPVTFTFLDAGSVDLQPLTVPPTGLYEGLLG